MLDAFEEWLDGGPSSLSVRMFESMIRNALGLRHGHLNAGSDNVAQNVILETDGRICLDPDFWYIDRFDFGRMYRVDSTVHDENFSLSDVAERLERFAEDHRLRSIPSDCQRCSMRSVCRGSHPASRFGPDGSFDHRSAYCPVMFDLSVRIVEYLVQNGLGSHLVDVDLRALVQRVPVAA
jgi:uncharacterized protein